MFKKALKRSKIELIVFISCHTFILQRLNFHLIRLLRIKKIHFFKINKCKSDLIFRKKIF